jgi:hypothetical protein
MRDDDFFYQATPRYVGDDFEPVSNHDHRNRCQGLAIAESWGRLTGLSFSWMPDNESVESFTCLATFNGAIVSEVSGVELLDGDDDGFTRVTQAELALQVYRAFHSPTPANVLSQLIAA